MRHGPIVGAGAPRHMSTAVLDVDGLAGFSRCCASLTWRVTEIRSIRNRACVRPSPHFSRCGPRPRRCDAAPSLGWWADGYAAVAFILLQPSGTSPPRSPGSRTPITCSDNRQRAAFTLIGHILARHKVDVLHFPCHWGRGRSTGLWARFAWRRSQWLTKRAASGDVEDRWRHLRSRSGMRPLGRVLC